MFTGAFGRLMKFFISPSPPVFLMPESQGMGSVASAQLDIIWDEIFQGKLGLRGIEIEAHWLLPDSVGVIFAPAKAKLFSWPNGFPGKPCQLC